MTDDTIIANCVIDELKDGPDGPGFYYTLTDAEGHKTDPIGPYDNAEAAEDAFEEAMKVAAIELIKQQLNLES